MRHKLLKIVGILSLFIAGYLPFSSVNARDVQLTSTLPFAEVLHNGRTVIVERVQDTKHQLTGGFTKTSRQCPPFCIQPMAVSNGVRTVGEAEMFEFMQKEVLNGRGMIVDARTPAWHKKGTIPGSVNIPFTVFEAENDDPALISAMDQIKAKRRIDVSSTIRTFESGLAALGLFSADMKTDDWDFSYAKDLMLWCNGPWCGQSPRAIRALLAKGFPAEKIHYYRGGMQMWQVLGLTVIDPQQKVAAK